MVGFGRLRICEVAVQATPPPPFQHPTHHHLYHPSTPNNPPALPTTPFPADSDGSHSGTRRDSARLNHQTIQQRMTGTTTRLVPVSQMRGTPRRREVRSRRDCQGWRRRRRRRCGLRRWYCIHTYGTRGRRGGGRGLLSALRRPVRRLTRRFVYNYRPVCRLIRELVYRSSRRHRQLVYRFGC